MRTLVIGLGNPVLTDDGVGWHIADRLRAALAGDAGVTVERAAVGGLALMEQLVGFDRAIVIDATRSGAPPGTVRRFGPRELPAQHTASAHDASLATALELGRRLGARLPDDEQIVIVGVEAADVETFGEDCTAPVRAAVPAALAEVVAALDRREAAPASQARGD